MTNIKTTPGFFSQILIVFVVLVAGTGICAYFYYSSQEQALRETSAHELTVICDLKVREISEWRKERFANALFLRDAESVVSVLLGYVKNPGDSENAETTRNLLATIADVYDYSRVSLLSIKGEPKSLLSVPADPWQPEPVVLESIREAVSEKEIVFTDFHRRFDNLSIRMTIVVPLDARSAVSGKVEGVLILRIDPSRSLYPMIETWPTSSSSAESLLVRRDGNEVVYLNELRHRKNTALALRFPIGLQSTLPAAKAALGMNGIIEGKDYRGIPVISFNRHIPGTPWYIVVKEDKAEIYAPLYSTFWIVLLVGSLIILTTVLSVLLFWTRQHSKYRREMDRVEIERLAITQHYSSISKYVNDIILLFDENFNIVDANDRAIEAYGYDPEELLSRNKRDLLAPGSTAQFEMYRKALLESERWLFEAEHMRKDGTVFPVEISSRFIDTEGKSFSQDIVRDITERRRGEEALRRSERFLNLVIENTPNPMWISDSNGTIIRINQALRRMLSITDEAIVGKYNVLEDIQVREQGFLSLVESVFKEGKTVRFEIDYDTGKENQVEVEKTVHIILDIVITPIIDDRGTVINTIALHSDITERKRAEAALGQSEARYKNTLETMMEGCQIIGFDWRYIYVNEAAARHGRKTRNELTGNLITEVYPGIEKGELFGGLLDCLENRRPQKMINRFEYEDRTEGWFELSIQPVPEGIFILSVDITERKIAEDALVASKAVLETALASMTDAVSISDSDGRFLDFNEAFATFHKFANKEECARTLTEYPAFLDVFSADGKIAPLDQWAVSKALRGETAKNAEYSLRRKDTGETWVGSFSFAPIRNTSGKIVGSVVAGRDITNRKRAEQLLRENEERLRFALDVIETGEWELNLIDHTAKRSLRHAQIFGYETTLMDWTFEIFLEHIVPEDRDEVKAKFNLAVKTRGVLNFECRIIRRDGVARWIQVSARHYTEAGDEPNRMIGIVQDITEQKRVEEEINNLNTLLERRVIERTAQLEAANKELEAFSYSVSHDLRAPLRAIDGFSNMLLDRSSGHLDQESIRYLNVIRSSTQNMGKLIDDLLSFSRVGKQEMRSVSIDMEQLAREVIDEMKSQNPDRDIDLNIKSPPRAFGDPTLIRIVLTNLLANAIKFTRTRPRASIEFGGTVSNKETVYQVKDNGVGFDMRYISKLFGVFQRLHRQDEFEGTGVGLALVQRIILRHEGRVWAEGTIGEGAVFYFALPGKGGER